MQADITTDGSRILARIPYAKGQGPVWAKMVPGARAVRDDQDRFVCWSYPLTMDTCRTFRRVFGAQLTVRTPLSKWAREAIKAGEALEEMRSGSAVRLVRCEDEAPFLAAAISDRSYQGAGVGFMSLAGQCIMGDEPGLGKTLQTLATLIERDARAILISCPRTATRAVWAREINRWCPTIAPYVAQGTRAEREQVISAFMDAPHPRKALIINHEMLRAQKMWRCMEPPPNGNVEGGGFCLKRIPGKKKMVWDPPLPEWKDEPGSENGCPYNHKHEAFASYEWQELFAPLWDAVVLDESHNLLASTYNVQSKHITQGRYGAMLMRRRIVKNGLALALSGTPARSNLTKFWGTLNWCRPDVFSSYWQFAGNHFGVEQGRYGKIVAGGDKVPKPLDGAAWDSMLRPYYLGRTKGVAAPDLPPISYVGSPPLEDPDGPNYVWLEMDERQRKAYQQMAKLAEANIINGKVMANGVLAEITRLRQFASSYGKMAGEDFIPALPSNKWEWLLDFIAEREGSDEKILVASSFTRLINLMSKELAKKGHKNLTLTGATSDRGRSELVRRFNDPDDPARIAIVNTRAGGEAITLDANCSDLVIFDPPWTSDEEFQLVSRIHRVSRIHQVYVYRLVSSGTVDDWMARNADEQRQVISSNKPQALSKALEVVKWQG